MHPKIALRKQLDTQKEQVEATRALEARISALETAVAATGRKIDKLVRALKS